MNLRKKKSSRRLVTNLTGKLGVKPQAIAVLQLRKWIKELPPGDVLSLRCESADPDKQFRVWKKWFTKYEDSRWEIKEEFKSFWFYKPLSLE